MDDIDIVVFQIARRRVELGDSAWLATQFDANAMPEAQLHALFGRVVWCFEGYDADPVELYAIPAVRDFLAAWRRERPHWLFFGSLLNDNLKIMYLSLLRDAAGIGADGAGLCRVSFVPRELGRLLAADLEMADGICERIGQNAAARLKRANDVIDYFGLKRGGRR